MLSCKHSKRHSKQPDASEYSERRKLHMSAKFFELPESDKRRIWAALLAEWQKKKAANRSNG